MADKVVKVSEEAYKALTDYAEKHGKTVKEALEEAIRLLTAGQGAPQADMPSFKFRALLYKAKCLKCGKELPVGSPALYAKGLGALCLDCFFTNIGDQAIIAKTVKVKELQRVKKALEKEVDRLVEDFERVKIVDEIASVIGEVKAVLEENRDFYREFKDEKIAKVIEGQERIIDRLDEIRHTLPTLIGKVKVKAR